MPATLLFKPQLTAFHKRALAVPGAKLYSYVAGTSTPTSLYLNEALTTAAPNPVIADASGRFPPLWANSSVSYKMQLFSPGTTTPLWETDPYAGELWSTERTDGFVDFREFANQDSNGCWTTALQTALDARANILIPEGEWLIDVTLREGTNNGRVSIKGVHPRRSIIKAHSSFNGTTSNGFNTPMLWFGNSSGHGNYRFRLENFGVDGGGASKGLTAIRAHECGTSRATGILTQNAKRCWENIGVIGSVWDGLCQMFTSDEGMVWTVPAAGTPTSKDDVLTTGSSIPLKGNINRVTQAWSSSVKNKVFSLAGGQTIIEGCTFQSCGDSSNIAGSVICEAVSANESFDFGGGPVFRDLWAEGCFARALVECRDTRAARFGGFFAARGDHTSTKTAIKLQNSPDWVLEDGTSFYGLWGETFQAPDPRAGFRKALIADASSRSGRVGKYYAPTNQSDLDIDYSSLTANHIRETNIGIGTGLQQTSLDVGFARMGQHTTAHPMGFGKSPDHAQNNDVHLWDVRSGIRYTTSFREPQAALLPGEKMATNTRPTRLERSISALRVPGPGSIKEVLLPTVRERQQTTLAPSMKS